MSDHKIIVVGASAGGVEALKDLVTYLPARLPATLLVVLHTASNGYSVLPQILDRASALPAKHAMTGDRLMPGHIYVAPPNYHLLVDGEHAVLSLGPKVNGHRPSIDALFRSAAEAFGPRVIGVVLSGMLADGALGLQEIKRAGGQAIVQDPQEALFSSMPSKAMELARVDAVLPVREIALELARLSTRTEKEMVDAMNILSEEQQRLYDDQARFRLGEPSGSPRSLVTCPDCGGVLWEVEENGLLRYRCHVGHEYSEEGMVAEQSRTIEAILWTAVRALEERVSLSLRLAERSNRLGMTRSENNYRKSAETAEIDAEAIRSLILQTHLSLLKVERSNGADAVEKPSE